MSAIPLAESGAFYLRTECLHRPKTRAFVIDGQNHGVVHERDDGVWFEENGQRWLSVYIADFGGQFSPGSWLNTQALKSFTARYRPYEPMIQPDRIVRDIFSLNGSNGMQRPSVCYSFPLNDCLQISGEPEITPVLTECLNLSYAEADTYSAGKFEHSEVLAKIFQTAFVWWVSRECRGIHPICYLPDGDIPSVDKLMSYFNHNLACASVREIMTVFNREMTELCYKHKIPVLYRNHSLVSVGRTKKGRIKKESRLWFSLEPAGHEGTGLERFAHFSGLLRRSWAGFNSANAVSFMTGKGILFSESMLAGLALELNSRGIK